MHSNWLSAVVVLGLASGFSAGAARAAEMTSAELSFAELSEMEQLLAQLNFDPGAVDGEVDDRTRTAIRLYQEFAILPVDGEPSPRLLSELRQVSQVYAEMRAAPPEPEPESEPESAPIAEPEPEVAAVEPPPATTPEAPELPAEPESAPIAEPEPEVAAVEPPPATTPEAPESPAEAEPVAAEPAPEPAVAAPGDLKLEAEPAVVEPEPEVAMPVEPESAEPEPVTPEPAVAAAAEPEPEVAEQVEPEIAVAESVEPEPEPVAPDPKPVVAEPEPEPEPAEAQVAEAVAAAPEPAATEPAEPSPEDAPAVAEPPTEPKAAPRFSIAGMIARLKERDHAEKKASSAQAALTAPPDPAGRERTLIWKVQQELRRIGLDPGAADGNLRTRTTGAIATYQRARGLSADGRISAGLLAQLEAEATPAAPLPRSEGAVLASVSPQAAATDATPSNGYQAFQAGYSAAQAGDFSAAVKLYDQAIDGGDLALEHLAAALYNRANAYQYLGVMEKAIEDYSAAIANKPSFPAAYYNRGFALDTKGEQGRAVKDFRKARDLGLQRLGVRSPDLPPPLL